MKTTRNAGGNDIDDREELRSRPRPVRIPDCPELEALVAEPWQYSFVRQGFARAHRVRDVELGIQASRRRPFTLAATWRRRRGEELSSVVVEAPIRGIPRLYADTELLASDELATALSIELVHRFGDAFAAFASTRSAVRLAVHGERLTRELVTTAATHLAEIADAVRTRLETPRPRRRRERAAEEALTRLIERTAILASEGENAFFLFRDAFTTWRTPPLAADRVWQAGLVADPKLRVRTVREGIEMRREGAAWPDLVLPRGGTPPDVRVTADSDADTTLTRVLRARLRRAPEWFVDGPIPCAAEFAFERGTSRLLVRPAAEHVENVSQQVFPLYWNFLLLEAHVMRFLGASRNTPRSYLTPLGYEALLGPLERYSTQATTAKELVAATPYLPEGWK
ncbi:MAG: hypothetical protein U0414_21430 [Polyangiaceae bacterium]